MKGVSPHLAVTCVSDNIHMYRKDFRAKINCLKCLNEGQLRIPNMKDKLK